MVKQMTVDEKVSVVSGQTSVANGCAGMIPGVERLGFPGICVQDGPNGLHGIQAVNGYAAAITVGAAWNKELAHARGVSMGLEAKAKGGELPTSAFQTLLIASAKVHYHSQQLVGANNRASRPYSLGWQKLGT